MDNAALVRLLGAILRQWLTDARRVPEERSQLAAFLETSQDDVDRLSKMSSHRFIEVLK